ncbi:MAG: hypothetical protein WKF37_04445 [Bryobacteraceae bacterium]
MEQLRQTPIFRKYVMPGRLPAEEQFRRATGVDIRSDIWEILVTHNSNDGVVMLRGKFTEMGMEPKLQREGVQRLGYKGYTMLGDERNAVAFLNPTTAIAGRTPALRQVIDRRNDAAGVPKVLAEKIRQIPSSNQVWFAGDGSGGIPSLESGQLAAMLKLLGNVKLVWGGIAIDKGLDVKIEAAALTEEGAVQLQDAIRGLIGFGRLSTPSDRTELLRLYDTMQVEAASRTVHLKAAIPEGLLEELIRLLSTASEPGSRRPN